ncbi:PF10825 family protein [Leptospira broomii serovar Hurstbridge str. 5399]|uniref:PF10825 family protein n=1 Tax=Leptospira broomii serovar Hurstbridge str. 5399 TaxID=1049789 RepID=T0GA91_9LEPT|nr:DUF2752 domain-containing protein [Leptospira broomii]EQA43729.1 PF10825 family protein [Leptospira broomii serovar Hurstbridge str. 5399]
MQNTKVLQKQPNQLISIENRLQFGVGFSFFSRFARSRPLLTFLLGIVAVISFSFYLSLDTESDRWFTLCWWKQLTGSDCPGCGIGRSLVCFFRGEISASWKYHPFGIPLGSSFVLLFAMFCKMTAEQWDSFLSGKVFTLYAFSFGISLFTWFLFVKP